MSEENTAPTPAGEEGERDEIDLADLAARLKERVDAIRKTRAFLNENGPALRMHDDLLMASRALLSSPRVERARALEEAAKVAEEFAESHRKPPHHNDTFWTAMNLAKAIRSLSPTDGAPANPPKVRTP